MQMALLIFIRGNNEMLLTKELTIKENTSKRKEINLDDALLD